MSHITVIYGPTASGKTRKALEIAKENGGSLLSFDSRHVYKEMDIVTGKDLPQIEPERRFGFDLVSPDEDWSTHHFYRYAKEVIEEHAKENRPLVLFGGSWPYAQVLMDPPESLGASTDSEVRAQLEELPVQELQTMVENEAPTRWTQMNDSDRSNPRRLSRALEVARQGDTVELQPLFTEFELILLEPEMDDVEKNIAKRVEERWNAGALQETQHLIEKYPDWSKPAFSSTGYGYLRQFLEGILTGSEAEKLWVTQERQYAKRQFTWLRKIASKT
jgi:tRNA dimethylallyltransferase